MNRLFSSFKALFATLLLLTGTALLAQDHDHADEHDAHAEHSEHDVHAHGAEHGDADADHSHEGDHNEEAHNHEPHADHAHGEHAHNEEFVAGTFIIHHIADAHDIHLFGDVHIPLPVILCIEGEGLKVFMSSAFEGHGHRYAAESWISKSACC